MKPTTQTRRYWILRIFHPEMRGDLYAYDWKGRGAKAAWALTGKFRKAKQFYNRSDARRVSKAKAVRDKLNDGDGSWFWEVVEITETITTTYEVEPVCGDAPAMVQIARAAQ